LINRKDAKVAKMTRSRTADARRWTQILADGVLRFHRIHLRVSASIGVHLRFWLGVLRDFAVI
jgi:hypothetical protein